MSLRYSSLACQYEELFSKLLANASNYLVWWCLVLSWHLFPQGLPSISCFSACKEENCIDLRLLWCVSHCIVELQSGGEMFPCCTADLSSACQSILGSISGGIGMPAIVPSVRIWIFHFGRVWWSWNDKVYREALNCLKWLSACWACAGDCTVPAYQVWSDSDQFPWSQSNISLWEDVLVLKGVDFPDRRIFPPERIFHFGRVCWSWKDWITRTVNRRLNWACYWILGGCMLFEIDLGGSGVYLELKVQQDMRPLTVLRDLYALKAN